MSRGLFFVVVTDICYRYELECLHYVANDRARDNLLRTSIVFICARQPDAFVRRRDTKTMRGLFFVVVVTRVCHYAISIIGAPAERMLRDRVRVADTRDVTRACKDRESARTKHTPDFDRRCRGRFDRSGT